MKKLKITAVLLAGLALGIQSAKACFTYSGTTHHSAKIHRSGHHHHKGR